jgi:metal-sulfur cluster biosynthetic enzyme
VSATLDPNLVWETLRTIPDPEFGINIVDLGLIYSVECSEDTIDVTMTLTTPSCPSGGWIYEGTKEALAQLPGAPTVNVAMVFEPPWSPEMLSESAQRLLGRIP